jgi:spore coat protein SA
VLLTGNRKLETENPSVALIGPELYPIPPIRGGAAELFIEKVADRLTTWRPVVIGVSDPELPLQENRAGVEYYRVPLAGWRQWLYKRYRQVFPFYDRQVAKIISRVKPDLIHVHNRPLLALYLKNHLPGKTPMILHLHNLYNSLGKRERPLPGIPIPVEALAACSRFVLEKERPRLGVGAGAYRVIYNGVDIEAFSPPWSPGALETRRIWRDRYGLEDQPTVLFAGKLRESKGVGVLLAAMEHVWQAVPGAALVLVGGTEYGRKRTMRETPYWRNLEPQLRNAVGRVVVTGFISPAEMPKAYLMGDVCAAPSQIDEGMPLVVLEALACGLPLITTPVGGIPEVVQDGDTGLLLNQKDDPAELAQKIIALLGDAPLRQRLGQQGRELVTANFSWEKIAATLKTFYDEVVAHNRPAATDH